MAQVTTQDPKAPILLHYTWRPSGAAELAAAQSALAAVADIQRPDVATYCFRVDNDSCIRFTEVYTDAQAFWSHVPPESEAKRALDDAIFAQGKGQTLRGAGVGERMMEGVESALGALHGDGRAPLLGGWLAAGTIDAQAEPRASAPVLAVVRASVAGEQRDAAVAQLQTLLATERATACGAGVHSAALFECGGALELVLVAQTQSALSGLIDDAVRALDGTELELELCSEADGASLARPNVRIVATTPFAGYVLHKELLDQKVQAADAAVEQVPTHDLFELCKNKFTGAFESIVFSKQAPGRSPHQYRGGVPTGKADADKSINAVPLLHLLRKLTARGSQDVDFDMPRAFAQLERLRSWQRDLELVNRNLKNERELSSAEHFVVERLNENLTALGYPIRPQHERVAIDGLGEIIQMIEFANHQWLAEAQAALAAGQTTYRGLLEAFPIGSFVAGHTGGLGGTTVVYRVFDSYMAVQRSMFGGAKFVFTLGLEFVANYGADFCLCAFEEKLEEFEGERALQSLPLRPLKVNELDNFMARGQKVADLGTSPQYRAYAQGSFFAHHRVRADGRSSGSGTLSQLGHHPGASFDNAGLAIQMTLKAYRAMQAASQDGESELKRKERIERSGLHLYQRLPAHLMLIAWPAIVAYSFTARVWGHALVEGLAEIKFSDTAWNELVLPARTKKLLYAAIRYNTARTRQVSFDVIAGKSDGTVILLAGPPGAGKTMTAEAIAEKFKRPLYCVSIGELGTTAHDVDSAITDILSLCSVWNALVLLDEGDALLEKREKGQLLLNSLTGVLLRALENFQGELFITSNRLRHIDRAVLSRVTLAVQFEALDRDARAQVWRNVLRRVGADVESIDVDKVAEAEISGRDILHVCKLALALATVDDDAGHVTQADLEEALAESSKFRSAFPLDDW